MAVRTLVARGYRVIGRNWYCRYGELDIIAEDGDELVFVEVKTRHGTAMGMPEEALTPAKWKRLLAAAQQYLLEQETPERAYRFDVVAIDVDGRGRVVEVRVHPNAFAEE
jgi:putative endonuclease